MIVASKTLREAHNLPKGWQPVKLECLGTGRTHIMVTGAVYPKKLTRGPRKGRTDFRKPVIGTERVLVITNAEYDAWLKEARALTSPISEDQP